jgi:hypothetical protein
MAEETGAPAYDWAELSGKAVKRLRAPKVTPVPEPLVAIAQQSWDGVPDPEDAEELLHVLQFTLSSEETAAEFAKLMRKTGEHTKPMTSVTVVIDPEGTGDKNTVSIKAGTRRGRATTN